MAIQQDQSRNDLLSYFGKETLTDRYLLPGEDYQDLFVRVSSYYADDEAHAQRLYEYMSKHWFMPATPILSNGGTKRGLPISCFLNEATDSLEGIVDLWNENVWLAARGGGIGSYWGNLRPIGQKVRGNGKTSGVIPFMRVQDALTLAISQGSLRRGSSALYLPVWHPEIVEFIEIRRPTGGDPNRKAPNVHHGVVIPDAFMEAVRDDKMWDLVNPKNNEMVSQIRARDLWIRLLTARVETGEPYMLFIDTVQNQRPESYKRLGLDVKTSNLCSEIVLATGTDHRKEERTAVCCLSSVNLEYYHEWENIVDDPETGEGGFISDIMRFLDNVLDDFIKTAPPSMARAAYSAGRERSIGLGVMGFHTFLQSKMIPWESVMAKVWNNKIFKHIREDADKASHNIALKKGPCPDAEEAGLMERFTHKLAIAPTASISIIAGNTSPGIEPYAANSFTQKTLTGSFNVRNKMLLRLLESKGQNSDAIWSSIATHEGSVQHLEFLTQEEKDVFKTASEIDQRWIIELAADRTPHICQATSVNLFLPGDVHKRDLHHIHFSAWEKGVKSLYYCRSTSIQRAEKVSHKVKSLQMADSIAMDAASRMPTEQPSLFESTQPFKDMVEERADTRPIYDECLACQ
ncbi:MAG: ribonucleoside-diphosphate reductase subunit alpha [Alphaproteobacteria bacterium]|nr:ribonucleoside-diphosphate reductase subunit alpha [Alphaproteobacteria bacterium]